MGESWFRKYRRDKKIQLQIQSNKRKESEVGKKGKANILRQQKATHSTLVLFIAGNKKKKKKC